MLPLHVGLCYVVLAQQLVPLAHEMRRCFGGAHVQEMRRLIEVSELR